MTLIRHVPLMKKALILVVEDEPTIQELIKFNLESVQYRVITCDRGEETESLVEEHKPDLILLDIMLPGIDGLEVCKRLQINQKNKSIPIIILSALNEEVDVVTGLELGACDYISKPFSPPILLARVKSALRRSNAIKSVEPNDMVMNHEIKIDTIKHKVKVDGHTVNLTSYEFKLLNLLLGQPGRVFTRYQIVNNVHGEDYPVTDRSVDVQIVGLRKKLGKAGNYIETVRGIGYRFRED